MKFWMFNLVSITIIYFTSLIDKLLIYTYSLKCLFLIDIYNKGIYIIGPIFLIFFVNLSMSDDSQDYIYQIRYLFFLHYLNCQYQSRIVFAKISKKLFFKNYLNDLLWDLEIFVFVDQVEDFIQTNLIMVSVINNIFTIQ